MKIHVPDPPAPPAYYPVNWQNVGGLYALDEENAKNLLKNKVLLEDYAAALLFQLRSLKEVK